MSKISPILFMTESLAKWTMVNVLKFQIWVGCQKGIDNQCRPRSDCFWRIVCYPNQHFVTSSPDTQHFFENRKRNVFKFFKHLPLYKSLLACEDEMSCNMWFPTMWHFDMNRHKPVQPPFRLKNSKWCSVSSLTLIEYSSDWQRLWSDCAYAPTDLRLCWSHIPHCWKSYAAAQISIILILL